MFLVEWLRDAGVRVIIIVYIMHSKKNPESNAPGSNQRPFDPSWPAQRWRAAIKCMQCTVITIVIFLEEYSMRLVTRNKSFYWSEYFICLGIYLAN